MSTVCGAMRWALESPAPGTSVQPRQRRVDNRVRDGRARVADRCRALFGWSPPVLRSEPDRGAKTGRYLLDVGAIRRDGGLASRPWETGNRWSVTFLSSPFRNAMKRQDPSLLRGFARLQPHREPSALCRSAGAGMASADRDRGRADPGRSRGAFRSAAARRA